MKVQTILIHLNSLAGVVITAQRETEDMDVQLMLSDCEEYLRRAARSLGSPQGADNDTQFEIDLRKTK